MATYKVMGGRVQARIKSKLLPKPLYKTFDNRSDAEAFCKPLEESLHKGIVPPGILALLTTVTPPGSLATLRQAIEEYLEKTSRKPHDIETLSAVNRAIGTTEIAKITLPWCTAYVLDLKVRDGLVPGSIRKRVGALRRLFNWLVIHHPATTAINPFASLAEGYSSINDKERRLIKSAGGKVQEDTRRDRRLDAAEEEAIRRVLRGYKRPDKERAPILEDRLELELLLTLGLESAMRLREMYTLTSDQIDIAHTNTVYLDKTKNGDARQVPLTPNAIGALEAYAAEKGLTFGGGRKTTRKTGGAVVFPTLFDGDYRPEALKRTTSRISRRFGWLFEYADMDDFRFHDIRHEATCRLIETGVLLDVEVARITGHTDPRMLKRYASLKGSDLAAKLARISTRRA
ncbi:GTP-binding protein LepA [Burkholderiales bacterium GJ-E10]|nr:GTP-binding protein LepA [Burkholderiales bacterium GJ-E10]